MLGYGVLCGKGGCGCGMCWGLPFERGDGLLGPLFDLLADEPLEFGGDLLFELVHEFGFVRLARHQYVALQ